jgi:hypothetical protein
MMARAYAGTVMLEGTTPRKDAAPRGHSAFGAPDIDARSVMEEMHTLAPRWLRLPPARLLV